MPADTGEPINTETQQTSDISILNDTHYLTLDLTLLSSSFQTETIPAVADAESHPYWEVLPEFNIITMVGYPISQHLTTPQIFIYPIADLIAVNEGAGQITGNLQDLLASHGDLEIMPFLPLYNAAQLMHSQPQYLNFQNGQGIRYLVWFSQGITPVNNNELIYTYQGITNDDAYYIAAVFPVNHPDLPADGTLTGNEGEDFTNDYNAYLAAVAKELDVEPDSSFIPDLRQLDALISSLELR
jgi:hypothetical protein